MLKVTRATDPVLAGLVDEELKRQENNIEMIASESTAPLAVMELTGSVFTNKTLEGYPEKRFQAGSHIADQVEELACERARKLFGAEHANIQSYSGSTANYSVFASVLNPGYKVLSMRLDQGGHLTHGSPANWVSKIYHFEFYAMDPKTELIDYDALDAVGITVNKNMIPFDPEKPGVTSGVRIGLTAVSQRGLKEPEIREIASIMNKVADAPNDEANLAACKMQAEALISRFPLYPKGAFEE